MYNSLSEFEADIRIILGEDYQNIQILYFQLFDEHQFLDQHKYMDLPVSELQNEEIEARVIRTSSFSVRAANCAYEESVSYHDWDARIPVSEEKMQKIRSKWVEGRAAFLNAYPYFKHDPDALLNADAQELFCLENVISVYSESFPTPSSKMIVHSQLFQFIPSPIITIKLIAEAVLDGKRALLLYVFKEYFTAIMIHWYLVFEDGTIKTYADTPKSDIRYEND